MNKLDMLKQKSAASAFFTSTVDMNTYDVKEEMPKAKPVKAEVKKEPVKEMKQVSKQVPKKEMKEEVEAPKMPKAKTTMANPSAVAKNGKAKIMDISENNRIKRCSYTLDNEVIRKVQRDVEEKGITAYDVFKNAFEEVSEEKVMMNIADADKSNCQNKCYTINDSMFNELRTKAFQNNITASSIVNTTLKMYYHM